MRFRGGVCFESWRRGVVRVSGAAPAIVVAVCLWVPSSASAAERVAAVWYPGDAAGVAVLDDLARIRALGFTAVVWPTRFAHRLPDVRSLADTVDLTVFVEPEPDSSSTPRLRRIDVSASTVDLTARAWRAIQDGIHVVAFDARQTAGAGLEDETGALRPWVMIAREFARQLAGNAPLFDAIALDATLPVEPAGAPVHVSLFRAPRAWLLIATHDGRDPATFVTRLPASVPPALWISLLDGSGMSMRRDASGVSWRAELPPGQALAYVINRD
jgi:hypothetical protein